jgi:hypothetical protein
VGELGSIAERHCRKTQGLDAAENFIVHRSPLAAPLLPESNEHGHGCAQNLAIIISKCIESARNFVQQRIEGRKV